MSATHNALSTLAPRDDLAPWIFPHPANGSCVSVRMPQARLGRAREAPLADLIPPRGVVGYDVIAHVGLERFLHHRQREEIRAALAAEQMRFQVLALRDRAFQRGNQRTLRSLPGLPRRASSRFRSRSAYGTGGARVESAFIRWRLAASHRCDGRGRPRHAWRKNLKAHCRWPSPAGVSG